MVGDKYVNIWSDENGNYLDGLQYTDKHSIFWTWSDPKEFYERYIDKSNQLAFVIHSFRGYGQPKLKKPSELKGVKQTFSIDYITGKCRCQCFVHSNDVWIKHSDYFSETMNTSEIGAPLEYLTEKYIGKERSSKFIYGDSWGSVVLRNEAWLKLQGLVYRIKSGESAPQINDEILRKQERCHGFPVYTLEDTDMSRFIERVINETCRYLNEKETVKCSIS